MTDIEQIIEWTEQEVDLDLTSTVQREFDGISELFTENNRLPLADILTDQLPQFRKYLSDRMAREQLDAETDKATDEQISRVDELERDIERLSRQIQEGDTFRAGARAIKESEFVLNDTLQAIVTFFRGLFK